MKISHKNYIEDIILKTKSFSCGNCGTIQNLYNREKIVYFENNLNAVNWRYNNGNYYFWYVDSKGVEKELIENEYCKYEYVVWKCCIDECREINISDVPSTNPISIIPRDSNWQKIIPELQIDDELLLKLLNEFYQTKFLGFNSSATMLARKMLMHIAVEQNLAKVGEKFVVYVDALKNSDLVSRNWKSKIDLIRKLGNEENHEVKTATNEELENISNVLINLLQSIYTN